MTAPALVIFDMDGTLVDSQHMIVAALHAAFAGEGLTPPSRKAMLSIVGLSLVEAMRHLVPGDATRHRRLAEAYKGAFQDLRRAPDHHEPLYEGAIEVLDHLRDRDDIILGIATGKSRRGVGVVLGLHGLERHFMTIQTADDHPSKPHPSMVVTALAECGIDASRAVMVGDTVFDMEMARAAGVPGIGVSWGYHDAHHLEPAGAHCVIDRFDALVPEVDAMLLSPVEVAS